MDMDVDLFGMVLPEPPELPRAPLKEAVVWERLTMISKPWCAHCQILRHNGGSESMYHAVYRRHGRNGSTLDLCAQHKVHQRAGDARQLVFELGADGYQAVRKALISTMPDPDLWNEDAGEYELLADYARYLGGVRRELDALVTVAEGEQEGAEGTTVSARRLREVLAGH